MTDGHRTSTIARPAAQRNRDATPATNRRRGRSNRKRPGLLEDLTTPIPIDKQIVPQRHGKLVVAAVGTLIVLAIAAALFVLPVKSWLHQRDDLAVRTRELQTLNAANNQLQSEVDRLQTDDGIREAARAQIDYAPDGEKRVTVLALPAASTALPSGWPYSMIASIVALRSAEAAAATATSTATSPTPATTAITTAVTTGP